MGTAPQTMQESKMISKKKIKLTRPDSLKMEKEYVPVFRLHSNAVRAVNTNRNRRCYTERPRTAPKMTNAVISRPRFPEYTNQEPKVR